MSNNLRYFIFLVAYHGQTPIDYRETFVDSFADFL